MNGRANKLAKAIGSFLLATAFLYGPQVGCKRKPTVVAIPEDKKSYLGFWDGTDGSLNMADDGAVSFKKNSGGSSSSVAGTFAGFDGNNIKVSVGFSTKTLTVQTPPAEANGVSTMTVEGMILTKKGEASGGKDGRERLANSIRDTYLKKNLLVRQITCPAAANDPNSGDFNCILETPSGEKFNVAVKRAGGSMSYNLDAVDLAGDKIEKMIEESYEKDTHRRCTAKCGQSVILKKVGDQFTCDYTDDKSKKQYKALITVEGPGKVRYKLNGG